jgi:hypothetical protein
MALSLRGAEAVEVLRHKNNLKTGLVASDCVAVLQVGARTFIAPIFIQKHSGKSVIESDFTFNEARPNTLISIDGEQATILRFEKIPQPVAPPPASPEPTEAELFEAAVREEKKLNPGENEWILRRRVHARFFNQGVGALKNARQAQSNEAFGTLPDKWAGFAAAAKRARNSR